MISIIILFTIAFCIYLFFGFYILALNPRKGLNQLFFIITLCLSIICISSINIQLTQNEESAQLWYKISIIASVHFFTLTLFLCSLLTDFFSLKKLIVIIIYLPPLIFSYFIITAPSMVEFFQYNNSWRIAKVHYILLYYPIMIYFIVYLVGYLMILFIWSIIVHSIKKRMQALILLCTLFVSITINIIDLLLLKNTMYLMKFHIPGLEAFYYMIWILGVAYVMIKYRFLTITTEMVSKDIIANIEESIILLNTRFEVITINDKTKRLIKQKKLSKNNLSTIIKEYNSITEEMKNMIQGEFSNFSCRIHFKEKGGDYILIDAKFNLIKDSYGDELGILIIGKEVKEIKQVKALYKITDREADIIQHLISGDSNKEIAHTLGITENTIKRHIANIYNKLNIDNKIDLINLLKDFDIIPEQPAEKTVLLLK